MKYAPVRPVSYAIVATLALVAIWFTPTLDRKQIFAMEPVVYDFAINPHGTYAQLLMAAQATMPGGYYAMMVPQWLRVDPRELTPVRREELCRSVLDREYSVFDRGIDNLVSALRRKLGSTDDGMERIEQRSAREVTDVAFDCPKAYVEACSDAWPVQRLIFKNFSQIAQRCLGVDCPHSPRNLAFSAFTSSSDAKRPASASARPRSAPGRTCHR